MQYTPAEQPATPIAASAPSFLTKQRKLIIIGVVLLAAFGYFGFTAFQAATSFYLTVDELVAQGPASGESVKVKGALVEGSFDRATTENTIATFQLHENGAQIDATYDGVLPDLFFNPHSEIVLEGTYEPGGMFTTDRVFVKCASKYQSLEGEAPYEYADPSATGDPA
ncbi:MAG: cytochrome c maturation protein CcmE [Chloroflexota bacterium]|nr:cytochrome c maturation protein CcmE [Chloroflexota bacterium]MDE2885634.1 cytochrome c maturation protein CcmE [Chloroflexota bacterium]